MRYLRDFHSHELLAVIKDGPGLARDTLIKVKGKNKIYRVLDRGTGRLVDEIYVGLPGPLAVPDYEVELI